MELKAFIIKNWMLFGVLGVLFIYIVINELKILKAGRFVLSVMATLKASNDDEAVLIDIRSENDFKTGHLPNARNIPYEHIEQKLSDLKSFEGKKIILYCATNDRSSQACAKLRKNHSDAVIYSMQGGINAWQQANLPLSKSKK